MEDFRIISGILIGKIYPPEFSSGGFFVVCHFC